jgi:hypothetical protein
MSTPFVLLAYNHTHPINEQDQNKQKKKWQNKN